MKKHLLLLLLLLASFASQAQQPCGGTFKVKRIRTNSGQVVERFSVRRDFCVYPYSVSGNNQFITYLTNAISSGSISYTLSTGQVIAAGGVCNYTVSALASTVSGCGGAFTLSATPAGQDATGLTYVWSGNNFTGVGQSVQANAPPTNGTYTYTVSANKSGCAARTGTVAVTVSGCGGGGGGGTPTLAGGFAEGSLSQLMALAPFVPDQNQYNSLPLANHTEFVDNGQARFGLRKSISMGLVHFSIGGGENWINTYANNIGTFEGQTHADLGRSGPAWSAYGTPNGANLYPYCEDGECTGQIGSQLDDVGWNAVQYGNRSGNRSSVLFYQRKNVAGYGDVLYTKTQPQQWNLSNKLAKSYIHSWYWLEGRALKGFCIQELFRTDNQAIGEIREQEWPFVYPIGKLYHNFLDTGTGIREVTSPPPGGVPNQTDTGGYGTVSCWGACLGDDGRGVFLVTPYNSRFRFKQFYERFGNEFSNESAYVNAGLLANFDQNHTSAYQFAMFGGNTGEFQSWYANHNFQLRPFEFTFSPGKLCGWGSLDSYSKLVNNQYTFGIGARRPRDNEIGQGKFFSPYGAWSAVSMPTIYIRGAFTNGLTKAQLQWRKAGSDTEHGIMFDVIGDGVTRTYAINVNGVANWNGTISTVAICNGFPRPALNGNETFIPAYIGRTYPGN